MAIRHYLNFILYFDHIDGAEKDPAGRLQKYSVRVFDSPVGEGEREEEVTIQNWEEIETWHSKLAERSLHPTELELFGTLLGKMMLPNYARQLYLTSKTSLAEHEGLKIRLRLIPELSFLPWEYALVKEHEGEVTPEEDYLALNFRLSIVRHEAISIPAPPFRANPYRRVIFAMASPQPYDKYPKLNLEAEQKAIKDKLKNVSGVRAEYYPDFDERSESTGITPDGVETALVEPADIFHFSGHGDYDEFGEGGNGGEQSQGILILADENNQAVQVPSHTIGPMLAEGHIRMVVLDACESGQPGRILRWSSVALSMLKGGIPAVVAQQFRVFDELAQTFASKMYGYLVEGREIDEAVTQGRKAIYRTATTERDWGSPVLYLRNTGGKIFPPVTDEHALRQAEKASALDSTRDQILFSWINENALASSAQLELLKQGSQDLKLSLLDAVLLLKSALVENYDPEYWVEQLEKTGKVWLTAVNSRNPVPHMDNAGSISSQLGLNNFPSEPPQHLSRLAWSAAWSTNHLTARTAAIALYVVDPENALSQIQECLNHISLPERRSQRALLLGSLADVFSEIRQVLPDQLEHVQDRWAVWRWRVRQRFNRNKVQLRNWSLGGAVGAGLSLAVYRGILAIFNTRFVGTEFAIQSYWGFIIGFFMTVGIISAAPLLLQDSGDIEPDQNKRVHKLAVLLGAVGFTLANGLVMWLNGLGITITIALTFLLTSFLVGSVLGLGLYQQPYAGWPIWARTWWKRLLIPALLLALLQTPVLCESIVKPGGGYLLENAQWVLASIFESTEALLNKYSFYPFLYSTFNQCVPGDLGICCLGCEGTSILGKCLEQWLSILDAALTGVVLVIGMMTGLHFPQTRLGKIWKKFAAAWNSQDN